METLRSRATIAVLWIVSAVAMSAHMILLSFDPTAMKKAAGSAGTAGSGDWVFVALFWLAPLWMAFAAMTMKGSIGRWVNLIAAAAVTILNIWHFFICGLPLLEGGPFEKPTAHHVLLVGSTVVATALIFCYAWRRPKQEFEKKAIA